MTELERIRDLFVHMEWADSLVWKALRTSPEAREDAGLRARLHHLHLVQRLFLEAWRGEALSPFGDSFADLDALRTWSMETHAGIAAWADGVDGPKLDGEFVVPWIGFFEKRAGRKAGPTSLADTALQAAMHSTYHRGQINTHLRNLGIEPPAVDFIVWVWLGRPAPSKA